MKTTNSPARRPKYARPPVLALLLCLAASSAFANPITGDTVSGNLTVVGDKITIDDGLTSKFELRLDADWIDFRRDTQGGWVWSHGLTNPTDVMTLDSSNILKLYDLVTTSGPAIVLNPGNPGVSPAIPASITIGGSVVPTASSASSLGFITSGNLGSGISSYLLNGPVAITSGTATATSSIAMSRGNASGVSATAMSRGYAYAYNSTAMSGASATGDWSTAMSFGTAGGANSTAMSGATASGTYSTAMSTGSAIGYASTAMSTGSANGYAATAMSGGITAHQYAVAMSRGTAHGDSSTAMSGGFAKAGYSLSAGRTEVSSYSAAAFGQYNEIRNGSGISTVWNGTSLDSVFEIGVGLGAQSRANALTVLQDGSIELGRKLAPGLYPVRIGANGSLTANSVLSLQGVGNAAPTIVLNPGNPDANPVVPPSITIGGSQVLTESSAPNLGFITSTNIETQILYYMWSTSNVALSDGTAYGYYSTAMSGGTAIADWSTAASGATANGSYSFAAGNGAKAVAYSSASLGSWSEGLGTVGEWVETEPILEVGNGTSEQDRSNAITTLKNGQTTLTNKAWDPQDPLADPAETTDSGGNALVIEGHAVLKGRVIIEQPQGDISMGEFTN